MVTVVGVKFKKTNKIYYFNPNGVACAVGDSVVVETARGTEIGDVVMPPMELADDKVVAPLKNVLRIVNERDLQMATRNKGQEEEAFKVFSEKIVEYNLDMKPVDVEYAFDGSKITFYFTADGRVDFRELVKGLAHHFRSRIELRQIGVRDEAKMLGGIGKCGLPICCRRFLPNFSPVSIKMAKEQNISLNPNKISGLCGRLMCCLNYEQEYYEQIRKMMPRIGSKIETPQGGGVVLENNYLTHMTKVRVEREDGSFEVIEVEALRDTVEGAAFDSDVDQGAPEDGIDSELAGFLDSKPESKMPNNGAHGEAEHRKRPEKRRRRGD